MNGIVCGANECVRLKIWKMLFNELSIVCEILDDFLSCFCVLSDIDLKYQNRDVSFYNYRNSIFILKNN